MKLAYVAAVANVASPSSFSGQLGNAVGFKLSSLTRIAETKSSCNKNMTLLHYIADTCDQKVSKTTTMTCCLSTLTHLFFNLKFRECMLIEADLPHVKEAAKVNMKELEKDMSQLRNGMKEVEREIEFFRSSQRATEASLQQQQQQFGGGDGDRYLPVMKEFSAKTAVRLAELEDLFIDMKARFDRVCRLFCEDPVTTQSDEFFGIFDYYITNFLEAKQENDAIKRKREEEEKMAKQQQEVRI